MDLNLSTWARNHLPPDYFRFPPSKMHEWLGPRLGQLAHSAGERLCILAPRGEAKSTYCTLILPAYSALEGLSPLSWICSDTQMQTRVHIRNLATEFVNNDRIAQSYPNAIAGLRVNADEIILGNGSRIQGRSTGQAVRGIRERFTRPTLIVLDDPESDKDARSAVLREANRQWFLNGLLPAGDEKTNVVVIGTAIHPDCLVMQLHSGSHAAGWESRLYQSIVSWPERMDLWAQWETLYTDVLRGDESKQAARLFYDAHRDEMDEGAELLWASRFTLYDLMSLRADIGHWPFLSEKQNSPLNPDAVEWPPEYFGYTNFWYDFEPPESEIVAKVAAIDPSKSQSDQKGDYAARVQITLTRDGTMWVEADLQRMTAEGVVTMILDYHHEYNASVVAIEVNQFQELFAVAIEKEAELRRMIIPIKPVHNTVQKDVRIRRLGTYLRGQRYRFSRSPGTQLLVKQMQEFPTGEHDDGPDAFEMALRSLSELVNGS